jgi:hypothetical protein
MRANAPRLGTFGGGPRFKESQHFYSCVSDTDKVPRRSAPFHNGPAGLLRAPVAAHIEHIYAKIGVSSRVQLASWLRTRPPLNE